MMMMMMMVSGIFYSKLMYCLPVFGNMHGLDIYRDSKVSRDDSH